MSGAAIRALVNAALFAGGVAAGCVAIGRALPLPDVPQVKEKLEWFRAHRGEYTALFLGTSRVRRHIIASLFDQLAAERGLEMRSFNLGVDSLDAPEDGYVLDQALAAAPPRLRYVFIELSYFRANFAGQGPDTIRAAYWHDWERTLAVWRQLWIEDFRRIKPLKYAKRRHWRAWFSEAGEWCGLVATHGRLFLRRSVNLGRGAAWLQIAAGARPANDRFAPLGPARDGFIPSTAETVIGGAVLEDYRRQLASLQTGRAREMALAPVPQANLEAMLAKVRAHGAEPVLFIAPTVSGVVFKPRREVAPLFDFSDPAQWPELFDPRARADAGHLNTAGAEVFTRALAGRFFAAEKLPAEHR